jgi:hypothetical protein
VLSRRIDVRSPEDVHDVQGRLLNRGIFGGLVICLVLVPALASAQGDGPRVYHKGPAGTNALTVWMLNMGGNTSAFNTNVIAGDQVGIDSTVYLLSYLRFFNLFGRTNQAMLTLPTGNLSAEIEGLNPLPLDISASGFADPVAVWSVNVLGAPAMDLKRYMAWQQQTILDVNLAVTFPFGDYDPDRALNLGTNRWTVRLGTPFVQSFGEFTPGKRTTLELFPSVSFFSDNDDRWPDGKTVSQDPLYKLEAHFTRDLAKGLWGSLDLGMQFAGRTSVDGVESDDSQRSTAVGITIGMTISDAMSMQASYGKGLSDPTEGIEGSMFRIKFVYAWNPQVERIKKAQRDKLKGEYKELQEMLDRIRR